MKKYLIGFVAVIGLLGIGYAIGRYAAPTKTETKIEYQVVEKEKIVEKVVYKEIDKTQRHIIEIEYPDGKKTREIWEIYESTVMVDSQRTVDLEKKVKELESQVVTNEKAQWKASALAGYDLNDKDFVYGGEVDRRIIGPVFVGGWGNTKQQFGISVGLEF